MPFPETEIQIRQLEHAQMLKRDSSVSAWLHLRSNLHTKEGVLWRAINGADVHGAGGSLFAGVDGVKFTDFGCSVSTARYPHEPQGKKHVILPDNTDYRNSLSFVPPNEKKPVKSPEHRSAGHLKETVRPNSST